MSLLKETRNAMLIRDVPAQIRAIRGEEYVCKQPGTGGFLRLQKMPYQR